MRATPGANSTFSQTKKIFKKKIFFFFVYIMFSYNHLRYALFLFAVSWTNSLFKKAPPFLKQASQTSCDKLSVILAHFLFFAACNNQRIAIHLLLWADIYMGISYNRPAIFFFFNHICGYTIRIAFKKIARPGNEKFFLN